MLVIFDMDGFGEESILMSKLNDYVLSIDTFQQNVFVLKVMLQSPRLKDHVQIIGIDQSLSKNSIYEHKCLENIKTYINELVSVATRNNSKIFSRPLWFLLLDYPPMTVPYFP